ncbi:MAG: thermonuclease family protein [Acidimicrobiales bacterium]
MRRLAVVAIGALLCVVATACELSPFSGDDAEPLDLGPGGGVVRHVVDGDTVELELAGGVIERVRLIGVDAPESVSRNDPVQCFGPEASTRLGELLPVGTLLRVERDAEARDRYDRLLLYLYRADDDLFVNEWLLAEGLADVMFFEPNTTFEVAFTRVRNQARAGGVGLWGACDGPDQPLDPTG